VWQCGQTRPSVCEGGIDNSLSQARHLKYMIAPMKLLILMLLISVSVEAQSLADAARNERERRASLRPTRVIISTGAIQEPKPATAPAEQSKTADAKTGEAKETSESSKQLPKAQTPPPVDPVQVWNNQVNQLRTKIRALQDQEMALLLQQNQATNQVYAPVTDPVTQERSLAQLGAIQQQLAAVRKDLEETKKMLDAMQLQGPPKNK
jgi:hypothetical protein